MTIDLGNEWTLEPIVRYGTEDRIGFIITGPAAPQCPYPDQVEKNRCGGLVRTQPDGDKPCWTIEQENPLTLDPSIECSCKGQHGHVVDGRYVPC